MVGDFLFLQAVGYSSLRTIAEAQATAASLVATEAGYMSNVPTPPLDSVVSLTINFRVAEVK